MFRTLMHATSEFYNNGLPVSGGTVTFYKAGTSTPKEVFNDFARTVSIGSVVTLDNQGRADIILGSGNYDIEVRDSHGVLLYTRQNITWDTSAGGLSVLTTDTDVSANNWVLDEDSMVSNDPTKVPTQQSVKAYVDNEIAGLSGGSLQPLGQVVGYRVIASGGTSLVSSDAGKVVQFQDSSPVTLTVPENTMSANDVVYVEQQGAGQVTIVGGGAASINVTSVFLPKTIGTFAMVTLVFKDANNPRLAGQLALA